MSSATANIIDLPQVTPPEPVQSSALSDSTGIGQKWRSRVAGCAGSVAATAKGSKLMATSKATEEAGFSEDAHLDDGVFWPAAFAVLEVTDAVEKKLRALVKRAAD